VTTDLLTIASGAVVGFLLGLFGGGGSILAVPLLLYVVGVRDPHIAIGTSAVAVGLSAAWNLAFHARDGNVKWPCALVFAGCGVAGALAGARVGQAVDGPRLMLAFALAMAGVGISLLFRPASPGDPGVRINPPIAARLIPTGLATGFASGFFGIGGGFLIVPGLITATNMTFMHAIGSSLVGVSAFAGATAVSYAAAGLVDWRIAIIFVVGGAAGGIAGRLTSRHLARSQTVLVRLFAATVIVAAVYVAARSLN